MTMHDLSLHASQAVVALEVVAWLVRRQLRARPVRERVGFLPIVLILLALQPPGPAEATATGIGLLVASLALSTGMGCWRATSTHLWRDGQGRAWSQGTALTATLWVVTVAIRIGLDFGIGPMLGAETRPGGLWLGLAVTLGVQRAVTLFRARRLDPPGAPASSRPGPIDGVLPPARSH
ncbi:MAG: hypothetical protein ACTHQE_07510 [Thermomicrobiales bacterium]